MRLKFKVQQYQTDATDAVCDVFEGQPNQGAAAYLRDMGTLPVRGGMGALFNAGDLQQGMEEGYANAPVRLTESELLSNIRRVERRNQLDESETTCRDMAGIACHLDVEMETGTGKTYVYTAGASSSSSCPPSPSAKA